MATAASVRGACVLEGDARCGGWECGSSFPVPPHFRRKRPQQGKLYCSRWGGEDVGELCGWPVAVRRQGQVRSPRGVPMVSGQWRSEAWPPSSTPPSRTRGPRRPTWHWCSWSAWASSASWSARTWMGCMCDPASPGTSWQSFMETCS
uniref:Uncharacterized protein n=1 Tax=Sus scrofa TaxID=9823 RepID=A0A8D1ZZ87_PIG